MGMKQRTAHSTTHRPRPFLIASAAYIPIVAYSNTAASHTASSPLPCSLMSSGSFWSDACSNAVGRPLQALVNAAYASCGVTVRCAPAAAAAPDAVCAAGSAVWTCV
jgi:hypothetical protein